MNKINYSLLLEDEIAKIKKSGQRKSLLLHACCAPCSSYVLEYLSSFFDITLYFYNPNISPAEEFKFREDELRRLIGEMPLPSEVKLFTAYYDPSEFEAISRGREKLDEGGARCYDCYKLRLRSTADVAKRGSLGLRLFLLGFSGFGFCSLGIGGIGFSISRLK